MAEDNPASQWGAINIISGDNSIIGFGNNDVTQTSNHPGHQSGPPVEKIDISELVCRMQATIQQSILPQTHKEACDNYLKSIKDEADAETPDKEFAAQCLKKINHVLARTEGYPSSDENVKETLKPLLLLILPWLGKSTSFLEL